MTRTQLLEQGRAALRARRWTDAFTRLSAADRLQPLDPPDLEPLATTAYLAGHDRDSADAWARAYAIHAEQGNAERAARCAFWLDFDLFDRGEITRGAGWIGQARRLLDGHQDRVERGYLLLASGARAIHEGDDVAACAVFVEAAAIGRQFADADLTALALSGEGRALIRRDDVLSGVSRLDEAVAFAAAGNVSPIVAGRMYCDAIEACHEIFDLRRAEAWTSALGVWCAAQPGLVAYRGRYLAHHAELLRFRGAWDEALDEALAACDLLSAPTLRPAVGAATYTLAELHRLRGELDAAQGAYREASRWRRPEPGLALLRLAQGDVAAAAASIDRAAAEPQPMSSRAPLLAAQVEIAVAAEDLNAARAAAGELGMIAARYGAPLLDAVTRRAEGSVALASGDHETAASVLHRAVSAWRDVGVPHEVARTRVLLATACRALGDARSASFELDAAHATFARLEARTDLARLRPLLHPNGTRSGALTAREVQVLRLVASGKTNRGIGADLGISEKTVARHVSSIFLKLDLSSRIDATAFAVRNELY